MKTCTKCQRQFQVAPEDLKFYEKMEMPEPTHCPLCRQQRRLSFRNEINFFNRKCDKAGAKIISMYPENSPYKIYDHTEWWKDDWDAMSYGRDFDFNKPFFEQFQELRLSVPRMSLNCIGNENSYYTNYALRNKNCYLITTADYNEQSLYGRFSDRNYSCLDFDFTYDSRFCYWTVDVHRCEKCFCSQQLDGCSENYFCYDMRNCHNCIFCAHLRNQSFRIFNKKVSAEEFAQFKKELKISSTSGLKAAFGKAKEFLVTQPRKYLENISCEECVGDYLKNCKNAYYCFDSYDLHDVKYGSHLFDVKDSYDWDFVGEKSQLCCEMVSSAGQLFNCKFCMNSWQYNVNCMYCDLILGNENLFGCVGLRKKKYCILNKQYTKEAFDKLRLTIIEHMRKTGEWGEFFPASTSPFAYNDSVAFEYFPMTKEETLAQGLQWRDEDEKTYAKATARPSGSSAKQLMRPEDASFEVADDIKYVPNSIVDAILACGTCGKNYKLTPHEIKFYKEFDLPAPRVCWICRHRQRRQLKNPRIVNKRDCSKCGVEIYTTYAQERAEPIYCEKCYLEFVS